MALNAQLASGHRDSRAFNKSAAADVASETARAPTVDESAHAVSPVETIARFPLRTRAMIILGAAALSWAAVIGLLMIVVG